MQCLCSYSNMHFTNFFVMLMTRDVIINIITSNIIKTYINRNLFLTRKKIMM